MPTGGLLALLSAVAGESASVKQVVLVCEHGSVKSLIAAEWFNRLARDRNLSLRSVSRGVEPDEAVPAGVLENLRKDGFDVGGFSPARLAQDR